MKLGQLGSPVVSPKRLSTRFGGQSLRLLVLSCIFLASMAANRFASGQEAEKAEALTADRTDPKGRITTKWNVVYREVGGKKVKADIYLPNGDGPHPIVVMVHGGAWALGDKFDLIMHGRELAKAGFVAVSVNYRLAPKHKIKDQLEDCRAAVKWVLASASEWKGDEDRLALWGYSAGGHLVSLLALDQQKGDPVYKAVAAGGAPCEFSFIPSNARTLAYVFGGSREEMPEQYKKYSPVEYARAGAPPFLFFHGDKDMIVPDSSSKALHKRLSAARVESTYYTAKNKGHIMTFLDRESRKEVVEFLSNKLLDSDHAAP